MLFNILRGLLTGKYSRESKEIPKDTRLHWSAQDKRRQMELAPDVAKYLQDEKFLNLIDVMKQVGNVHGKDMNSHIELRYYYR